MPETPAAETVAGIEGSGAGGERFQTPRGGVEADASDGGAADADVPEYPILLEPSARICTACDLRYQTQRELIDHLLETHGVEAHVEAHGIEARATRGGGSLERDVPSAAFVE